MVERGIFMDINTGTEAIKQLGITAFVIVSVLAMCWFLLKKTFDDHKEERGVWMKMAETHFANQVKASEYQRDEHVEILRSLAQITTQLTSLNGKK